MDSSGGGDGNGRIGVCKPSTSTGRYWTQGGIRAGLRHHGAALHALPGKQSNLPGMKAPPLGIAYDTPEQIKALSEKIAKVSVYSKTIPLANATQMTDEEREILGRWIAQGAEIPTIASTTTAVPKATPSAEPN